MNYEFFSNGKSNVQVLCEGNNAPLIVLADNNSRAVWMSPNIYALWDALILHVKRSVTFENAMAIDILSYIQDSSGTPSSAENLNRLFDFKFVATLNQDVVNPTATTKLKSNSLEGAIHLLFTSQNVMDQLALTITPKA